MKAPRDESEWQDDVKTRSLIDRLQKIALRKGAGRETAIEELVKRLFAFKGIAADEEPKEFRAMCRLARRLIDDMAPSMAEVRAAEIVLKKVTPDLAQTEFRGKMQHVQVVRLPNRAKSSEEWAQGIANGRQPVLIETSPDHTDDFPPDDEPGPVH